MSAVVTTLIIILLVIVALAIIWVVIKNLLQGGAEQIEISQKCRLIEIDMKDISVEAGDGDGVWDDYSITLSRTGSGENATGIKILLGNSSDYSEVIDFGYDLTRLATKTNSTIDNAGVVNATYMEITPYFVTSKGKEELCPNSFSEEF